MSVKINTRTEEMYMANENECAIDYMMLRKRMDNQHVDSAEYAKSTRALTKMKKTIDWNKATYVRNIGMVLSQTRERIYGCALIDDNTVRISFSGYDMGKYQDVDVSMCSWATILKEVVKCL